MQRMTLSFRLLYHSFSLIAAMRDEGPLGA